MSSENDLSIDNDFTVEPAHPAPAQSPRSLDKDQAMQREHLSDRGVSQDDSSDEQDRPKTD